jgi:DMSO/TMAO reductase YedYZ molybdopterin-dependent catalytic subunit
MKTGTIFIVSIGLLIAAFLAVLFLVNPTGIKGVSPLLPSASAQTTKNSQEVEINNYQGERLDPISNFQENSIKGPQKVDLTTYRLTMKGPDNKTGIYTYEDVLKLPHDSKVITLNCVEGWSVKILWEGVRIMDLLAPLASAPAPAQSVLFGGRKPETLIVKFIAVDGYSTSLPLKYVLDKNLLLAYKMNGVTLPPERGFPFQLVAEDKWGYKWIKWVQAIELTTDTAFKGYWESRGYNQDGDQKGPIFD